MKGCEDYLLIALHAHVVAAAKEILSTTQYDSVQNRLKKLLYSLLLFSQI